MKLTINTKVLASALKRVQPIATGGGLPALTAVLISASGSTARITASNLDAGIEIDMEATVEKEGSILVSVSALARAVSATSSEIMSLTAKKDHSVILSTDSGTRLLNGLDPSEFPPIPKQEFGEAFDLEASVLLPRLSPYQSKETSRWQLCGIQIRKHQIQATDGRSAVAIKGRWPQEGIIPSSIVALIHSLGESPVTCRLSDNAGEFRAGSWIVTTKLIQGSMPDFDGLAPDKKERTHKITVNRLALYQAVREVGSVVIDRSEAFVKVEVSEEEAAISIKAKDGQTANIKVPVKCTKPVVFSAATEKLHRLLDTFETEEITLEIKDPLSPGVVENGDTTALILFARTS